MEENLALNSLLEFLGPNIMGKRLLLNGIARDNSPSGAWNYLKQRCRSMSQLEGFLHRHSRYLMVENDMVCAASQSLARGREGAAKYFSDILWDTYDEPCHYVNLRGHIGQADRDIQSFIESFYHEKKFMDFLLAHPGDYVVFNDDKVHDVKAMEEESVEFYRNCLENHGGGYYYTNFRGHFANSKYVREYIQQFYPEEEFLIFLQNNDDVFQLEDGHVYLQ